VTPQGGPPTLLRSSFLFRRRFPKSDLRSDLKALRKFEITMSGAFNLGEGRYAVEVLFRAEPRSCYKRCNVQTGRYSKQAEQFALKPWTVAPLAPESWDGMLDTNGARLTVLLDAAPMNELSAAPPRRAARM
jgi:hypothetical protein